MASLNTLVPKKRAYVKARVAGATQHQAALKAGYSAKTARCGIHSAIETDDVKAVLQSIIQSAIPAQKLASVLAAGLDATTTQLCSHEGKFTDERTLPDYARRLSYAQVAAEYAGYVAHDQPVTNQVVVLSGAGRAELEQVSPVGPAAAEHKAIDVSASVEAALAGPSKPS